MQSALQEKEVILPRLTACESYVTEIRERNKSRPVRTCLKRDLQKFWSVFKRIRSINEELSNYPCLYSNVPRCIFLEFSNEIELSLEEAPFFSALSGSKFDFTDKGKRLNGPFLIFLQ